MAKTWSRLKHGFESRWNHHRKISKIMPFRRFQPIR